MTNLLLAGNLIPEITFKKTYSRYHIQEFTCLIYQFFFVFYIIGRGPDKGTLTNYIINFKALLIIQYNFRLPLVCLNCPSDLPIITYIIISITRRVFANVQSCKIWVMLSLLWLLFWGNNKVLSYFVGLAQKSNQVGKMTCEVEGWVLSVITDWKQRRKKRYYCCLFARHIIASTNLCPGTNVE